MSLSVSVSLSVLEALFQYKSVKRPMGVISNLAFGSPVFFTQITDLKLCSEVCDLVVKTA